MDNNVRTTVYIDKTIRELIQARDGNLSKIVNELLEDYISVNNEEQCKKQLKKLEEEEKILKKRLERMRKEDKIFTKYDNVEKATFQELLEMAQYRIQNGMALSYAWATGPKIKRRLQILGYDAYTLLDKLDEAIK